MHRQAHHIFGIILLSILAFSATGEGQTAATVKNPARFSAEKPSGFYNLTSFTPVTFNGDIFNSGQIICGYRFMPQLAVGGGTGYEGFNSISTYDTYTATLSMIPVFLDIRYTPLKGKISPVVALDAGYRFLLNRPTTQSVYDTSSYPVITVSGRSTFDDQDLYWQGGPFITGALGLKVRFYGRWSAYFAVEYSLWSITGDRYTKTKNWLLGDDEIWRVVGTSESTMRTTAYVHAFQVRLGIGF